MRNFILTRLGAMVLILIALTAVLFVLQHISPMDPVKAQLGANASAEAVAARRHTLGLDQPMINQFWHYLTGAVHGDLGTSFRTRHAVSSDLGDFVPATLELALYGHGPCADPRRAVGLRHDAEMAWREGAAGCAVHRRIRHRCSCWESSG